MKIGVTGWQGFIGRHLAYELSERGHLVEPVCPICDDLRTCRELEEQILGVDILVHCAAIVGRGDGERNLAETASVNAGLTGTLANLCTKHGKRFVYVSSSEVYQPFNMYGLTKRWGEEVTRLYCGDNHQVLRLSMPYGPGHMPGTGRAALTNFLWLAMHDKTLVVHRGAARSWNWIGDATDGMARVIEWGRVGVYNVGRADNETSMMDVARRAIAMVGSGGIVEIDMPPDFRQSKSTIAFGPLLALGWKPQVELSEGMRRTYEWLQTL